MKTETFIALILTGLLVGCSINMNFVRSPQGADFYPLETGTSWIYFTFNGELEREILNETFSYEGKEYKKKVHRYESGQIDTTYHRKENGTVYSLDNKTFVESVQIPAKLKEGFAWVSNDEDWKYEIITTDTVFSSPEKEWQDAIMIQARQLTGRDDNKSEKYNLYYAKDIGHVGSTTSTGFSSFLMEWEKPKSALAW